MIGEEDDNDADLEHSVEILRALHEHAPSAELRELLGEVILYRAGQASPTVADAVKQVLDTPTQNPAS